MRFKSPKSGGFQVFAVAGVNTVSFGIDATATAKKGLRGFGVERTDAKGKKKVMAGFKVFRSIIPNPNKSTRVTTMDHPVQSFVWDDFTAADGAKYTYSFIPLKGKPGALVPSPPVVIDIETEPLFSTKESDVFFNRGVASSQAYTREFGNTKPDDLPKAEREEALEWLSRKLDDAILQFIAGAKKGDALRCCFYEFRYEPVARALAKAINRGVDVKIIVDGKKNGTKDKDPFPRKENLALISKVKIDRTKHVILREARTGAIQHNKFMVLLKGPKRVAAEVWTGSTNMSMGGVHGQTNVGHWLRNRTVASRFLAYWKLLGADPGGRDGDTASEVKRKNAALRSDVGAINDVPDSVKSVKKGVTPIFSPRSGGEVLDLYFELIDTAATSGCITLAFGINADLKKKLVDNTSKSQIVFLLLEKEDVKKKNAKTPFIGLNASNNVYQAFGSYLGGPVYQWARETNTRMLQMNQHVAYIHSKFLLRDPLGADPLVVTGSANFSKASTNDNDENMLVIRGDRRVADIYFTEFNRLFNHYYFRAVHQATGGKNAEANLFLDETSAWLKKYQPGKLKQKRLDLYVKMKGV